MRQICEGVAATYDGQRMVRGQLVICEDHCVFSGSGVTREYHWGAMQTLDARRVDVAVPNTQGQRQQPALRLSNGETAQLWMMSAELVETMLQSIAREKEIDRCVTERVAAVNAEFAQMREQLARKDETIRQTSVRLQVLEEQLRAYEAQQTADAEQTLALMTELETAQQRVAELTQQVAALMAGQAAPAAEAAPAAAEFVPAAEPEPVAEEAEGVSPDELMQMLQTGQETPPCEPLLVTTLQAKLAGTTAYNADGSNRQRIIRDLCRRNRLREEQELLLERSGEGYAVLVPGDDPEQIGCLSAEDAAMAERAVDARAFVMEVTGGANGGMIAVTVRLQLYMSVRDAEFTLPRLGEGDGSRRPAPAPAAEAPVEAAFEGMKTSRDEGWPQAGPASAPQWSPAPEVPVRPRSNPFGSNKDKMKF